MGTVQDEAFIRPARIVQDEALIHPAETIQVQNVQQPEPLIDSAVLPNMWDAGLPKQDHKWISKALFRTNDKGKAELLPNLKLWYYPPQPTVIYNQPPSPDYFFGHRLLCWMPYRLWKIRVFCPERTCLDHQLTGGGLHRRARQVLDVDGFYHLVTETLRCSSCNTNYISWSKTVLDQLDFGHRTQFRVILTRK